MALEVAVADIVRRSDGAHGDVVVVEVLDLGGLLGAQEVFVGWPVRRRVPGQRDLKEGRKEGRKERKVCFIRGGSQREGG